MRSHRFVSPRSNGARGHYDQALVTLNKAKPLVQDATELSYNEALIYDSLGRYDDALTELKQLLAASAHPDGNYSDAEKSNRFLFLDRPWRDRA